MSDVAVIGTGAMGSALVEALSGSGAEVTVWNRTTEKVEALRGPWVRVAESVVDALTSSPLVIVSVASHNLALSLVEEAGVDLTGKAIMSTSYVTEEQAREFDAVVKAAGGGYLDLSIPAYPSEIRSGAGLFLMSGDRASYEVHEQQFERIGRVSFVDDAPGAAHLSEIAILLAYLPMAVGLLQGIRMCEAHDISLEWFRRTVEDLYPFHIRSLLDRALGERAGSDQVVEASVDVWGDGAGEYAAHLRELGFDAGMYDALARLFTAASEDGHGEADWIRIAEHVATREPAT